jgi:hypothetical protein
VAQWGLKNFLGKVQDAVVDTVRRRPKRPV